MPQRSHQDRSDESALKFTSLTPSEQEEVTFQQKDPRSDSSQTFLTKNHEQNNNSSKPSVRFLINKQNKQKDNLPEK